MNILDVFDTDEQIAVNQATKNELLQNFNKDALLKRINFILAINQDEQISKLYEGLKEKINSLTEDEWTEIKAGLPYKTPYSDEDLAVG